MLRGFLALILLLAIGTVTLPFLVSSLYIDQRGVAIPGHVSFKQEFVRSRYAPIQRVAQITVEYSKPDGSGVAFLDVPLSDVEYDAMHVGQSVSLNYLRPQDLPGLPFAKFLRGVQLLPTVHLAGKGTFATLRLQWTPRAAQVTEVLAGMVVLLLIWRIAHIPGFAWVVAACVLGGLAALTIADFPRPMPAPSGQLGHGVGRVRSIERITRLFNGSRRRGVVAEQPIQVVQIEFVPEGRTDAVLAIDLIDANSIAGLQEKGSAAVTFERASPRNAYLDGATRNFVSRNIRGVGKQTLAAGALFLAVIAIWFLFSRGYKRLLQRA